MMKGKLTWHNHPVENGYVINATSDYTDKQLMVEIPKGTNYDKFHDIVDDTVFQYLVDVHNAIVRKTNGKLCLFHNIGISGNLICHNLYKNYKNDWVS